MNGPDYRERASQWIIAQERRGQISVSCERVVSEADTPSGEPVFTILSRRRTHPRVWYGLDYWRALFTLDRSWWVSVVVGHRWTREVLREKYRTRDDAERRVTEIHSLAERGKFDRGRVPFVVWRRWGPE